MREFRVSYKESERRNSLNFCLGLAVLLLTITSGCSGHVSERASAEPQANKIETPTVQSIEPTENAPGIVVHIDPTTGQIISPPAGVFPGQSLPPVDTTTKVPSGPRETLSPVPGGGVLIHLDDRFMNPLTATIDADGKARLEHKQEQSGSGEKQP